MLYWIERDWIESEQASEARRPVDGDSGDEDFRNFVAAVEPRLRRALVAAYGHDRGRDAAAEALAYAWEHWKDVSVMANPAGYLFRVGQSRTRRRRHVAPMFPMTSAELPWVEPALPGLLCRVAGAPTRGGLPGPRLRLHFQGGVRPHGHRHVVGAEARRARSRADCASDWRWQTMPDLAEQIRTVIDAGALRSRPTRSFTSASHDRSLTSAPPRRRPGPRTRRRMGGRGCGRSSGAPRRGRLRNFAGDDQAGWWCPAHSFHHPVIRRRSRSGHVHVSVGLVREPVPQRTRRASRRRSYSWHHSACTTPARSRHSTPHRTSRVEGVPLNYAVGQTRRRTPSISNGRTGSTVVRLGTPARRSSTRDHRSRSADSPRPSTFKGRVRVRR